MVDINLEDAQFDPQKLYEEAQKAGLDIGDLEEYGFNYKKMEFSLENVQQLITNMVELQKKITEVLVKKVSSDWNQAQCYPEVRRNITPRVQFVWNMFPLNHILGALGLALNVILLPCIPCWGPCMLLCGLPWNLFWYGCVMLPLIVIFFGTLPCVTCFACCL